MTPKIIISTSGNVIVPAYLTLLQKGYLVTSIKEGTKDEWIAENEKCGLIAEDPLTLLGLVNIYEIRGNSWKASDEQTDRFLENYGRSESS